MALQAGSVNTRGANPEQSKTLDMEKFWSTATPYPKTSIEKWRKRFLITLVAKTRIRHADIRRLREEQTSMYPPEEPPPLTGWKREPRRRHEQRETVFNENRSSNYMTGIGNIGRAAPHRDSIYQQLMKKRNQFSS